MLTVDNVSEGMIVVIQGAAGGTYSYTDGGVVSTDYSVEITDSIHKVQAETIDLDEDGNPDGWNDSYRYFRQLHTGNFIFTVSRACYLTSMLILIDQSKGEEVSTPSFKISAVNGESRDITINPGESTLGGECSVWYGIVDAGETPLYLKNTDEIIRYDYEYIYEEDENGNSVKVDSTAIPVYKQVLEPNGDSYGESKYEGTPINVSNAEDEDGDGYVTIGAATVSSLGGFSEIAYYKVSVGEIQLNAPTLSLTGVNGTERTYTLNWENNTLCKEDYSFVVSGDNGEKYFELEPNTGIGNSYTFSNDVTVTVKVDGYLDGVCEMSEVDFKDVVISRKNQEKAEAGAHDWDLTALSEYQKALLIQDYQYDNSIVEKCMVITTTDEVSDTTYYTAEEFLAGISNNGDDLSSAIPVLKASGWDAYDSGRYRTARTVVSDTIFTGEIFDKNENGYGYVKDEIDAFKGINIVCPPNAKNASTILQYYNISVPEYNGDGITTLGTYFMSKPTFTFPRETVKAGEIVIMYVGYGGSNYTNTRSAVCGIAPTDSELSISLAAGAHVLYLDVYTYDNLPEDTYDAVGVKNVTSADAVPVAYFNMAGARSASLQKGMNIVKYSDGSVKKMYIK
jgi:hypothetical protein